MKKTKSVFFSVMACLCAAGVFASSQEVFSLIDSPDYVGPFAFNGFSAEELNAYNASGRTPLLYAIEQGRVFEDSEYALRASYLAKAGADVNLGFKTACQSPFLGGEIPAGTTPLMLCVLYSNWNASHRFLAIEPLLANKAAVNAKNEKGMTAVMYAVQFPNQFTPMYIDLFRQYSADFNLKDKNGLTALDHLYLWLEKYEPGQGGIGTKGEVLWARVMSALFTGANKADIEQAKYAEKIKVRVANYNKWRNNQMAAELQGSLDKDIAGSGDTWPKSGPIDTWPASLPTDTWPTKA